jgi:hypothetical protein
MQWLGSVSEPPIACEERICNVLIYMPACSPNGIERLTSESRSSWQSGEVMQKAGHQALAESHCQLHQDPRFHGPLRGRVKEYAKLCLRK